MTKTEPGTRLGINFHPGGWRLLLIDLNIDEPSLMRRAGLPEDWLTAPPQRVAITEYYRLWGALEVETADATLPLPLLIGLAISVEWFAPVMFAALCSADLDTALLRLVKFKRLCSPVHLDIAQTDSETCVTVEWIDKHIDPPPGLIATELVFLVQLARLATRCPIKPQKVKLPKGLAHSGAYASYFGVEPIFADRHSVSFSASDAKRPFYTANEGMWSFFEPALRKHLDQNDREITLSDRVQSALLELLSTGSTSMLDVSRKMAVSSRTLQRKLQQEGLSFQKILRQVRTHLALHYLQHSHRSSAEIALLLGFNEPDSFVRAFRSWTGDTPHRRRQTFLQAL